MIYHKEKIAKKGGYQAKKSLGQHWLTSKSAVTAMVRAAEVEQDDTVLEVGPGKGVLTEALLATSAKVVAIEKDARMIDLLRGRFADARESGQFALIEGDALEVPTPSSRYKVVANIPYYITGLLFRRFFEAARQPESLTLLVQKEVAERIARSKKESILSLSVKAYGTPRYIQTVKAGSFSPPPTVDSAILHIADISRKNFETKEDEGRFFELVKAGFSSKRKTLASNLKKVFADPATALAAAGIPEKARAEDVSLEKWLTLVQQ